MPNSTSASSRAPKCTSARFEKNESTASKNELNDSPMAATGGTSAYRSASAASTWSSCVLGDALGITWTTLPSPSMMNVARWMPMYVLP